MSVYKEAWVGLLAAETDIQRAEKELQRDPTKLPEAVKALARYGWEQSPSLVQQILKIEEHDPGVVLEVLEGLYGKGLKGFKLPKVLWSGMDWKYSLSAYPESALPSVTFVIWWEVLTESSVAEGDAAAKGGYSPDGHMTTDVQHSQEFTENLEDFTYTLEQDNWEIDYRYDSERFFREDRDTESFHLVENGETTILDDVISIEYVLYVRENSEVSLEELIKILGL